MPPSRSELRKLSSLAVQARQALAAPFEEAVTTKACEICEAELSLNAYSCPDCGVPTSIESRREIRTSARASDKAWMSADVVDRLGAVSRQTFDYNAEQRRKMAKAGTAMKDGSFPIANCSDAEKAIHAQGRAKNQDAAVAHIKKRVRSMGCSGPIFENYK